jgi:hypothetical protein
VAESFGRDRILFDLIRSASNFHLADITKDSLELIGSRECVALQRLLQSVTFLLGADGG